MFFKILLVVSLIGYVQPLTEMEIKIAFMKLVMKCLKEHPVEISELTALQQFVVPKKPEVKCLLACAYKMEGVMTEKGLYSLEHAYKVAELSKNGDQKRLENGKKVADICVKINEEEVSDGEKGCERAAMVFKCIVETAPKVRCEDVKYERKIVWIQVKLKPWEHFQRCAMALRNVNSWNNAERQK